MTWRALNTAVAAASLLVVALIVASRPAPHAPAAAILAPAPVKADRLVVRPPADSSAGVEAPATAIVDTDDPSPLDPVEAAAPSAPAGPTLAGVETPRTAPAARAPRDVCARHGGYREDYLRHGNWPSWRCRFPKGPR